MVGLVVIAEHGGSFVIIAEHNGDWTGGYH